MKYVKALVTTGALLLVASLLATSAEAQSANYTTTSAAQGTVNNDWNNQAIGSGASNITLYLYDLAYVPSEEDSVAVFQTISEEFAPGSEFSLDIAYPVSTTIRSAYYYNLPSGNYNISQQADAAGPLAYGEATATFSW
jgi:hypothetical protein